ncbi:hypothetical protein IE53DRAFT_236845 [Violaceomyces palustris]|uniref:Uncharacterized protein n=1 Tax=Violaceomyces palustris TaxID=1673888 RepID=A0ACD0P484_9BASI|nr:hypothetical protein IE53DRAFT_236845 [Violaceomyces palustris]
MIVSVSTTRSDNTTDPAEPHESAPSAIVSLSIAFLAVPAILLVLAVLYALYKYGQPEGDLPFIPSSTERERDDTKDDSGIDMDLRDAPGSRGDEAEEDENEGLLSARERGRSNQQHLQPMEQVERRHFSSVGRGSQLRRDVSLESVLVTPTPKRKSKSFSRGENLDLGYSPDSDSPSPSPWRAVGMSSTSRGQRSFTTNSNYSTPKDQGGHMLGPGSSGRAWQQLASGNSPLKGKGSGSRPAGSRAAKALAQNEAMMLRDVGLDLESKSKIDFKLGSGSKDD